MWVIYGQIVATNSIHILSTALQATRFMTLNLITYKFKYQRRFTRRLRIQRDKQLKFVTKLNNVFGKRKP